MGDSFTHLHLHTEFSMLDGAARVKEVVAAAAADGQPAIGITDHGNMYGILDFYKACRDQGITPVLGTEAYMAGETRFERPPRRGKLDDTGGDTDGGHKLYYHLTLLAENDGGYRNLIKLSSQAFLDGYYYKPRCDWELLDRHAEGVIATTGCLGGHVLQALLQGDVDGATAKAARLQDIFGRDNLFVELQDHGLAAQKQTNPQLIEIARRIGAPLLATNDSHYTHREDHVAHDALLCVQTGALRDDPNRFKFEGDQHYLKSAAEMRRLFRDHPEACDNTLWIAERADVEIEFGKPKLPTFPLPDGFTSADDYLHHLAVEGAKERYGQTLPTEVVDRLAYELGVISQMGFSDYFLIVWDLIRFARERRIRVGPGRGSAAGCCVAYCLRIVDLDPIKYDLLFERFLNPGRLQMPDIDMDFDDRYRGDMIKYATERYGWDHVAQIITFSTIKARAAVRDAARVLGYPYVVGDKIAKAMPPLVMGRDTPLYACLEPTPKFEDGYKAATELRDMYATDPDAKAVIDVARGLEGLRRQDSIHAAAVVITDQPLTEYLPIQRKPEPGGDIDSAPVVTQYEMHGVEELGLLKMDFLGLRNLSVIEQALDLIEESTGQRPDIDDIPLDDSRTYQLLQKGDSIGVFQLEGNAMRALMRSLAPTTFEDVAALVALYRPGPMAANMHNDYADRKNGRKPVEYFHPEAEEILGATYGLCLAGDTVVHHARTGRPTRLDEIRPEDSFLIQGVTDDMATAVRPVTHWVCNGVKQTVRLRLSNGAELTGTPDHLVLTYDGWKPISALGSDDFVAVPKQLVEPLEARAMDRDRLRVLGYLIADGSLSCGGSINFTNSDPALLQVFRDSVTAAFPSVCANSDERPGSRRIHVGQGRGNGRASSSALQWLRELGLKEPAGSVKGGPRSDEKFVPDVVFSLENSDIAFFLAALWDCDGHVNERLAIYTTTSPRLAADVRSLLMRLGFAVSVYKTPYTRARDGASLASYQVTVFDGPRFRSLIGPHLVSPPKRAVAFTGRPERTTLDRREVLASVRRASERSMTDLAATYGFSRLNVLPSALETRPRIQERAVERLVEGLGLEDLAARLRVQWVRVADVRPAGEQLVYDITVDEIHNFVANGMVVHNCIFQEQMMRIAQKFAGYSLEEADNLRKAAGKKIREVMAKERDKFVDGCERTGFGRDLGTTLFDMIEPFADYAFNRSHSVGYGFVAYQTAWLKAHHPVEYLAALLTSVKSNLDKAAVYLNECRQMGIQVLVPDVNVSHSDFIARGQTIPFGLSAVRNVGEGLVGLIIEEREQNGPFADFYEFCERVDTNVLNKRTIESLIKAGGFDSMGHPRRGLLEVFEQIVDQTCARRRERDMGVMTLFGEAGGDGGSAFDERPKIRDVEFDKRQRLAFEKEMLGLYVSDHPLMGAEGALRRRTDCTITDLREAGEEGAMKTVGGVVTALQRKYTKKGDLMAVFMLEDLQSAIEVMVFPKTMQEHGFKLSEDRIVCVKGRLDAREDLPKIIAMDIELFEPVIDGAPPVRINLPPMGLSERVIAELRRVLKDHPGESQVFLHLGEQKVLRLPDEFCVDAGNGLVGELREMLGATAVLA